MLDTDHERAVGTGSLTATASPAEAAAYLGVQVATLATWRSTRRYPLPYIKVGRLVRYRWADLDLFIQQGLVKQLTVKETL